MHKNAKTILNNIFGYKDFFPLQDDIIKSILNKKDALIIMPTGGGKSICYQIPAMISEGLTVVISPLISLMKDQIYHLQQLNIPVTLLNSSISFEEYNDNIQLIQGNKIKLLYLAPETLLKPRIISLLSSIKVDIFAIDEAHCISEWGHDFRPEYRELMSLRKKFPHAVFMALTATATSRVRDDIKKNLNFKNSNEYIASFNRKNLLFEVIPKNDPFKQTLNFLKKFQKQSGIIYCFSRKQVDTLSMKLKKMGYPVKPYHAGLSDKERTQNQEAFIKDEEQIIVATIAFGMGIHKTNVRFILHYDLPKSIEAYYQETGRAGRDGLNAHCLLLYSYSDVYKIKYFIDRKTDENEKNTANLHLNAILQYCESENCRRIPLINYFGEEYTDGNCGMCDNCNGTEKSNDDITIQAKMFLSCIKRADESFGSSHIINILRGSESQKILKFDHHKLSTHGIGKEFSKKEWQQLYFQFIQKDLIFQDHDTFGVLKLTKKGYNVMMGNEKVQGQFIIEENNKPIPVKSEIDNNNELFQILRTRRRELAEKADVPPYIIFSDKTLIEMSIYYPQSKDSLLMIHGVGSAKLEKYGDIFSKIISGYCSEKGIKGEDDTLSFKVDPIKKPKYITTGELYNSGNSIENIATQFKIKITTVINNLYRYITEVGPVNPDGIYSLISLKKDEIDRIINTFDKIGAERLKPVFLEFEEKIDYETLAILRLYYLATKGWAILKN